VLLWGPVDKVIDLLGIILLIEKPPNTPTFNQDVNQPLSTRDF
jgi:hypothetical protein